MKISSEMTKKRDSYHHGDLRAQLLEATRQLVEEKGPDHFSVSEACRRARVSTAAPYKHFKDKTEMLREVAIQGMRRQSQQMIAELQLYPERSLDRVIAMGRVYVRFATSEPGVFRLMFTWSDEDTEEDQSLNDLGQQIYNFVKLEVAKCLGHEDVTDEVELRALMLWSFVHGLSFLSIDDKLKDERMANDLEVLLKQIGERVVPEAI